MNLKIAKSAMSGQFNNNPFVQGLLVQLMATLDKQERGITTLRGRPSQKNETENRLLEEACLSFALAGGNSGLAKQLGQKTSSPKIDCDSLLALSLPNPMLSLSNPAHISENSQIVDRLFPRLADGPVRRLIMAVDHTYLQKGLIQSKLRGVRGLVGGAWSPESPETAFLPFDNIQPGDTTNTPKASMMLECLVWDPCTIKRGSFSLASAPMTLKRKKEETDMTLVKQGNLEMMKILGVLLESTAWLVRAIAFDAHQAHAMFRQALFGQLSEKDLEGFTFWQDLKFEELPSHSLPRLPARVALYHGDPIYPLPGPCLLPQFDTIWVNVNV